MVLYIELSRVVRIVHSVFLRRRTALIKCMVGYKEGKMGSRYKEGVGGEFKALEVSWISYV